MAPATITPSALAKQLLKVLHNDRERHLLRIDAYLHGEQDSPYMPPNADDEYRLLSERCISNWMPLLVNTPGQALYVDGFRKGDGTLNGLLKTTEWDHWQLSRLDAKQIAIHKGALAHGHSFAVTEKTRKGIITKGLSALKTSALFEDPANDHVPYAALTVTSWEAGTDSRDDYQPGTARMWDGTREYAVRFSSLDGGDGKLSIAVTKVKAHGASECPVTRFAAAVDLEGRTVGVIEPMIALQNRINQTVFDLLVAQTYASFKVRYATGMAPPIQRDAETGEPLLDPHGNPVPVPMNHNARRFLFAEDHEAKFGSLDETPLDGFIKSIDMSIRHLSALSQTPPHHLLGQIANLSAEALLAAETALSRKIEEFRKSFGESWERVFRLAGELSGDQSALSDNHAEVLWRDMEQRSLAQAADALGKLKDQLGIPAMGLWNRVPNVTQTEIEQWEDLVTEQDSAGTLAEAVFRATGGGQSKAQGSGSNDPILADSLAGSRSPGGQAYGAA